MWYYGYTLKKVVAEYYNTIISEKRLNVFTYCCQYIITKLPFSYTSITKL